MNETEKIKQAITDFVKGGDNSDVVLLDKVLHQEFRVTNNGFMGISGVTIIDKNEYLSKIKMGVFGGLPRKMEILELDQIGTIASVKLKIESSVNDFISYNSLVLDTDEQWKIINNLAEVTAKNNLNKEKVLILGRLQEVMNHVKTIIEAENFETKGVLNDDTAFELLRSEQLDYFMIGGGIKEPNRTDLIALATSKKIKVLEPKRGDKFTSKEFLKLISD